MSNTEQRAFTPGPLTVKRGQFGSSVFVIYGQDGFPIAQTISNSSPEGMERARRGEHEANAKRLAHCWNEYDALLKAAQEALRMLEHMNGPTDKLRAALTRATTS